jgi:hypothetical protein
MDEKSRERKRVSDASSGMRAYKKVRERETDRNRKKGPTKRGKIFSPRRRRRRRERHVHTRERKRMRERERDREQ